jgi:hypothetical protein
LLVNILVSFSTHHTCLVLVQTDNVLPVTRKDENGMLLELRIDSGSEFELESTNDGRAIGGVGGSERKGEKGDERFKDEGRSEEGGDLTG